MMFKNFSLESLVSEMQGEFRDRRLTGRLQTFLAQMAVKPSEGFPKLLQSEADLEGWYRFVRNRKVTPEAVLKPHFKATRQRVLEQKQCLLIHDTSTFCFSADSDRDGLCQITKTKQGFFGHFSLACTAEENPIPLGLLGLRTFVRRDRGVKSQQEPVRQMGRWHEAAIECADYVGTQARLIHVMDRESDTLEVIRAISKAQQSFVIRARHDRCLQTEDGNALKKFSELLIEAPVLSSRTIKLSRRDEQHFPTRRKMYPARKQRLANVYISAIPVVLRHEDGEAIPLSLVQVKEIDCPDDAPVEWLLLTDQEVVTPEQANSVVDIYRKRWIIEEFFKALKTGCAYEKRQMESRQTLEVVLAVFCPIAWRLLLLRGLSRQHPDAPAQLVITETQTRLLRGAPKVQLSANPTTAEVVAAIARLGGHIKSNGPPGWLVLARGFDQLLWMEAGWRMAMEAHCQTYDQ